LVGERTTIINRLKATLTRLGIRNFNPKLVKAPERLEHVRTPEGEPIPPNTQAELLRDMQRLRSQAEPNTGPNLMVSILARVILALELLPRPRFS
jgi:transposase